MVLTSPVPSSYSGVHLQPMPPITPQRVKHRQDQMLDDTPLLLTSMEPRVNDPTTTTLYYLLSCLTLGNLAVISQWPFMRLFTVRATTRACGVEEASLVIVHSQDGQFEVCEVEGVREVSRECASGEGPQQSQPPQQQLALGEERMIVYRHTRYLLRGGAYSQLHPEEAPPPTHPSQGLPTLEATSRLTLFGRNLIDVPIPPWPTLLLRECVHPFVVFQIWAVVVWLSEGYITFSLFILATALATAVTNLMDLLKNLKDIRRLSLFTHPVRVIRGGVALTMDSSALVPGDVVVLEGPCKVPADMVVLSGQATVTEAMLTGEAVVVTKTPLPTKGSLGEALATPPLRCTLFCGTQVVAVRGGGGGGGGGGKEGGVGGGAQPTTTTTALVLRTGFDTVKGRLVLSILYPKAVAFKFLEQSLRFIAILFALALVGFAVNAKALSDFGAPLGKIIQRGADMITIVVPPALPLAITVGTLYALIALKKQGVSCISPAKVNVAGKVNAFCFDKTGTLTEEGLKLLEVRPSEGGVFVGEGGVKGRDLCSGSSPSIAPTLTTLLATCHSLVVVEGVVCGDPLEVEVFSCFQGGVIRVEGEGEEVSVPGLLHASILHRFEFTPQLARMGVIVESRREGGKTGAGKEDEEEGLVRWSFVKGAPETMQALCNPASLPSNFTTILGGYTRRGLRVLAAAGAPYRGPLPQAHAMGEVEIEGIRREAEAGLEFLGLIVLENPLKPESKPTLARLKRETGGMPLIMVTGDNPISALAVARECGMVEGGDTGRVYLGDLRGASDSNAGSSSGGGSGGGSSSSSNPPTLSWCNADAPMEGNTNVDELCPVTLLPLLTPASTPPPPPAAATGAVGGGVHEHEQDLPPQALEHIRVPVPHPPPPSPSQRYSLAMTGRAFMHLVEGVKAGTLPLALLHRVCMNCTVFARMPPEAKAALVETLQGTGLYVGMIGDGANDSMALKVAHVGISLSTVEASVAAPFTSSKPTIEAIVFVMAEGRGALATSFSLFQFMALYSTIQFANALLAVQFNSFLSNNMYLYQDLWIVFVLSLTLGATPSAERLGRKRPSGRLFSAFNLTITAVFIATTFIIQIITLSAVRSQGWYGGQSYPTVMDPQFDTEGTNSAIPETTSVFIVASYQFLGCAAIFSVGGYPWKKWPTSNTAFCAWFCVIVVSTLLLTITPTDPMYYFLSLQRPPYTWNLALFGLGLLGFMAYFVAIGGVYAAKGMGWISMLEFGKGPMKPHKVFRREWAAQWVGEGGQGGASSPSGGVWGLLPSSPFPLLSSPRPSSPPARVV